MGRIKHALRVLLVLFCLTGFSQSKIIGTIRNNANEPIQSASVILKDGTNRIVSYTYSDKLGNYSIQTQKKEPLTLFVNAMGYESKSELVVVENEKLAMTLNITLTPKVSELKEMVIETTRPVTVKKDTITFDVKSFAKGNEQVVEDLLKRIPGLNIASDGTIKVGNQEIEKVMVDGDDMFEKGYRILTQNMPVNPIEKVELYQNYSSNKHLKGIENSAKVALNLTLKEDFKRQRFGNMNLGYGLVSEDRYQVRSNLMNFGEKAKYYFLTNLNNIGEDATGDINHLIRPYRFDEPASIGDDKTANTLLSFGTDHPTLKKKRINFNNAELLSLNSIFTLSDKAKIKILGFFNADQNNFFRNSYQSFSVGTTSFENAEMFIGRKKQSTGFGKLDFIYDLSKTSTLEYVGKFNKNNEKNSSDLFFNGTSLNEKLKSNNQFFDHKMVVTNKFKDNKVLLFSGRYSNEKTPQNYSVNQFVFQDLFNESANNSKQYSQDKMQFAGFEVHLLDKRNNCGLLEVKLGNQLRKDNLNTRFQLFEDDNILEEPIDYQNNLKYASNDSYFTGKYSFKLENFTVLAQSGFHFLHNRLENGSVKKSQSTTFIVPKVGLDWAINDKNKLMTSYSYTTANPGVLDVYSGYVQTGFRSFSKGLDEFNQLNASSAVLNYTYGSWDDRFFANTYILYTRNNDFYSANSVITQNYTQSEKIIIRDRAFLSAGSTIDRYFKSIKSNLKINLGITKVNFKNIVNNSSLREVNNLNTEYGVELRSGFRGVFNYHIGSKWNYNQIKTTTENSFTDTMTFLDLSFVFNDKMNVELQSERYLFGNLDKNNNNYFFSDLEASYVVKENTLSFFLSGNNLFNTKIFKNYAISDINVSKTEYRLMPRYVLLKMEYRF